MPANAFYRNGVADEMLFVHEGSGVCDTVVGPMRSTAAMSTERNPPSSRSEAPRHSRTDSRDVSSAGMAPRTDARGDIDDHNETRATAGRLESGRDIDLAGRDLLALGRMAAAGGDAGAAQVFLTGAVGSGDPAVAGEASSLMATADMISETTAPRLGRRRVLARKDNV